MYWPTSIKDTIQWFSFLAVMEHTANIINPNKGLIPSLLHIFSMLEFILIDNGDKLEAVAIRCINSKKETGLYLITSSLE